MDTPFRLREDLDYEGNLRSLQEHIDREGILGQYLMEHVNPYFLDYPRKGKVMLLELSLQFVPSVLSFFRLLVFVSYHLSRWMDIERTSD
jgi:hypothetical protein